MADTFVGTPVDLPEQYQKMLAQVILSIQQADQTVLASREKYKYFEREFGRAMQLFRRDSLTESQKQESELRMVESRVEMRNDEMNKEMYTIGKAIVELLKDTEIGKQEKVERDQERAAERDRDHVHALALAVTLTLTLTPDPDPDLDP